MPFWLPFVLLEAYPTAPSAVQETARYTNPFPENWQESCLSELGQRG